MPKAGRFGSTPANQPSSRSAAPTRAYKRCLRADIVANTNGGEDHIGGFARAIYPDQTSKQKRVRNANTIAQNARTFPLFHVNKKMSAEIDILNQLLTGDSDLNDRQSLL